MVKETSSCAHKVRVLTHDLREESPKEKKLNSQNTVMMTETLSTEKGVNGTNGASPGMVEEQPAPGRNPATAKLKWTKEINKLVMECYIRRNPKRVQEKNGGDLERN